MATEKVSLTLDESLLASARERAGGRGLSGYMNEALRRQLQRDRLHDLLEELELEHGVIGSETMDEVREAWPEGTVTHLRSA